MPPPQRTPDGRYIVVLGKRGAQLWRAANPHLPEEERSALVRQLMEGRRAVRTSRSDADALRAARDRVDAAKRALGERGPVWWDDGAPDFNRKLIKSTSYWEWWVATQDEGYS
jgi:hypothetical protein